MCPLALVTKRMRIVEIHLPKLHAGIEDTQGFSRLAYQPHPNTDRVRPQHRAILALMGTRRDSHGRPISPIRNLRRFGSGLHHLSCSASIDHNCVRSSLKHAQFSKYANIPKISFTGLHLHSTDSRLGPVPRFPPTQRVFSPLHILFFYFFIIFYLFRSPAIPQ
jgi:hypothetical protein